MWNEKGGMTRHFFLEVKVVGRSSEGGAEERKEEEEEGHG